MKRHRLRGFLYWTPKVLRELGSALAWELAQLLKEGYRFALVCPDNEGNRVEINGLGLLWEPPGVDDAG